ncbi:unnamed protein product [Rhizophagus irregularis]|nr:unnamed protein product [Rhizophagus irregularis]
MQHRSRNIIQIWEFRLFSIYTHKEISGRADSIKKKFLSIFIQITNKYKDTQKSWFFCLNQRYYKKNTF